jgi:CDP-diacylglycerol--serine O-phosphatidyltransferase
MTKYIPNLLTLLNLLCGCIALTFAAQDMYIWAFAFVALGIFFDFFDGFLARLFNVAGPLGVQLDSLADMVTSGMVPGYVIFQMLQSQTNIHPALPYAGFIITLGACYRLANFNIDTRQSDSFIGLPTPANALFFLSLPIVKDQTESLMLFEFLVNPWVLIALAVLSAWIMNAELPLFSLKVKHFSWQTHRVQVIFLAISVVLIALLWIQAVPLIIAFYVLLSAIVRKRN